MVAEVTPLQPHLQARSAIDEHLHQLLERQRAAFRREPMPCARQRRAGLDALRRLLVEEQQAIIEAIHADFGQRSADETRLAELLPCIQGIRHARRHLRGWMRPSRRSVGLAFQPASARVVYQPLGVVGIMVPWNYPLFLAIGPLIGALAAGNRAMIKMSESTPVFAGLLQRLLARIFDEEQVAVVTGEVQVGIAFSRLPFDHLLFTGATGVGRQVMHAVADNLTPLTLELGGKSPALVAPNANLAQAAERIAWGKALNAGQTCIAPDYVLVPASQQEAFVGEYRAALRRLYPRLSDNPDYTAIINDRQLARLNAYLEDAQTRGARLLPLFDEAQGRRVPHTLLLDVHDDMRVMREEIFGPLLPVVPYRDLDEAIDYINQRPRPLALYFFGRDRRQQRQVLERTHSGGVCLNDTLLHVAQDDMPFGGIGPSGMGHYHGHEGFLTFSKAKAVFVKGHFNAARLVYPPYGGWLQRLVYRLFIR